jgi:sulfate transport system substrate-binding protein
VVVEANARRHGNEALAAAFLAFLTSEDGQRILSDFGFRPLEDALDHRPQPERLLTMADLGGWSRVKADLYDAGGVWDRLFTSGSGPGRPAGKGRAR